VDDTETYSGGDAELAITVAGAVVFVVATTVSVDAVVLAVVTVLLDPAEATVVSDPLPTMIN
jgi:hypothetical protein